MKCSSAFTLLGKTCLLVALVVSSCTKSNDPDPVKLTSCRITKRSYEKNPNVYWLYQYDGQDRLSSIAQYQGSERVNFTAYEYDSLGLIVKQIEETKNPFDSTSSPLISTCTYKYNSRKLTASYACTNNRSTSSSKGIFEYDAEGNRIKSTHEQISKDTVDTQVILFEYKDGNCVKTIHNPGSADELTSMQEYYLDQENKFREGAYQERAYQYLNGGAASRNMLKKVAATSKYGFGYTDLYTYQYNEHGFPVREQVSYRGRHNLSEKGIGLFLKTEFQTFSIQDLAKESFWEQALKAV